MEGAAHVKGFFVRAALIAACASKTESLALWVCGVGAPILVNRGRRVGAVAVGAGAVAADPQAWGGAPAAAAPAVCTLCVCGVTVSGEVRGALQAVDEASGVAVPARVSVFDGVVVFASSAVFGGVHAWEFASVVAVPAGVLVFGVLYVLESLLVTRPLVALGCDVTLLWPVAPCAHNIAGEYNARSTTRPGRGAVLATCNEM